MLETKDLVKIYKPKKGVPVTAIDKISLKFPDTGMVFLLGKSGSGKSTLLNLLGGLDQYDGGEIIIKGVSSKNFSQKHFDSYRNTYVGFIFQEYNVLEEFTVGANIALALELQGKKADDEEINRILTEVDLEGYGSRKPNELSGGQKQRVAIARALVKSPEIIMADEPTGALDSNTGRQVFDTLKKLSKTKLVIVVSHDRDFASQYADRIIELADGQVISDMELCGEQPEETAENGIVFDGAAARIPQGYHLTEEDRVAINEYIDRLNSGGTLDLSANRAKQKKFAPTDLSKIAERDGSAFKLIKSKLPLKNAFKIGGSGLKYKKFRLAVTILLSCAAFSLFGLADTFGAYDHIKTCTNSIADTGITYASLAKAYKIGSGVNEYWHDWNHRISEEELESISKDTGITFKGVLTPENYSLDFASHIDSDVQLSKSEYSVYATGFSGLIEINQSDLNSMQYKLIAGKLPDGSKNELALSKYICETFIKAGYADGQTEPDGQGGEKLKIQKISTFGDMVGRKIILGGTEFTVTGVIDTLLDFSRYSQLAESQEGISNSDALVNFVLYNEFNYAVGYNYTGMAMVGDGFVEKLAAAQPKTASLSLNYIWFSSENMSLDPNSIARLSDIDKGLITWLDGEKTQLGEKELIVTSDLLNFYESDGFGGDPAADGSENSQADFSFLRSKTVSMFGYKQISSENINLDGFKIVGVINTENEKNNLFSTIVTCDSMYSEYSTGGEGVYSNALGTMPQDKTEIKDLVAYCYNEDTDVRYQLNNPVTYELDSVNEVLRVLAKVFLYIGLGFALFAAIMLANFIATSISYKKQEIGILRAIGSRSNDVFRIFFAESFIIAAINFVLSCIGVGAATAVINHIFRTRVGILITVLNFGVRQIALILAVSLLVAALASFLPVRKIAAKRPIDAIRNR